MARKVLLDVDTGVDDALALMLALRSPELEVLGVTCVAGNTTLEQVTRNTLAVLELCHSRVPVAVGARKPLASELRTATFFHGENGLGNVQLPQPTRKPVEEDAPAFMTRLAQAQPGEITLVAVGPLTNVALAVLADAQFVKNLAGLIVMGGAVSHPGNASPAAEANFSNDPEAAAAVVASGATVQLVDLGATSPAVLPLGRLPASDDGLSAVAQLAWQLLQFYGAACLSAGAEGAVLHDPLAVGLAAQPDLATPVPLHLEVETCGRFSRGATLGRFTRLVSRVERVDGHDDVTGLAQRPFNATVARQVEHARFVDLALQRLELTP